MLLGRFIARRCIGVEICISQYVHCAIVLNAGHYGTWWSFWSWTPLRLLYRRNFLGRAVLRQRFLGRLPHRVPSQLSRACRRDVDTGDIRARVRLDRLLNSISDQTKAVKGGNFLIPHPVSPHNTNHHLPSTYIIRASNP